MQILLIVFFLFPSTLLAKTIGTVGTVYEIKEKDAALELKDRAKNIDIRKIVTKDKLKKILSDKRPEGLSFIGKVKEERTYLFTPSYTLEFDIVNGKGVLVYPKGYTFNPLDYIKYPNTLVFIDGSSKTQVAWFKKSGLYKDASTRLLVTDGSAYDLTGQLNRPVFFATTEIVKRVGLSAVPSVISQQNNSFKIREIYVAD